MKRLILIFAVLLFFGAKSEARDFYQNPGFNYFYSHLEPYGEWIQLDVDFYVWKPHMVGANWRPYTNGRWHWTTHGWYWESFEPYGWATFHYGRWYYDDYYDWVWIPGKEWAPAWVEWRYNDSYIGWAPLPPYADFNVSVGIHFNINWNSSPRYWSFVRYNHFYGFTIVNYIVPHYYVERIYHRTRYRNNYGYRNGRIYNEGINRNYVERRSGRRIKSREVVRSTELRDHNTRYRDRNRLEVYAPSKKRIEDAEARRDIKIKRGDRRSSLKIDKVIRGESKSRDDRRDVRRRESDSKRKFDRDVRNNPGRKDEIHKRTPEIPSREKRDKRKYIPKKPDESRKIEKRNEAKRKDLERKIERNIERRSKEKINRSNDNKKRQAPRYKNDKREKPSVKSRKNKRTEPKSKSKSRSNSKSKRKRN